MALARTFQTTWTQEQYDEVIRRMDLGGHSAQGVLFHWAGPTDTGVRAIDVYSSREDADRLAQELIGPIVGELGLPMPEITESEVSGYLAP